MTPGIHLLHKPIGPTSFSLVKECMDRAASDASKPPRICHGGTLDPFASGLLLILVEPATRLFDYLHDIPKVYEATVQWGTETDNGDPLGKVTFTGDAASLSAAQLDDVLAGFVGWGDQIPHATSAKRIDGERAYVKAHRGETVVLPPSRVYMHEASWLAHNLPHTSRLRITVRGGYYIRALARDLGRHLGCGAHLAELQRTSIGPWIDPGVKPKPDQPTLIRGRDLLPWLPSRQLTDAEVGELRQDRVIPLVTAEGGLLPPDWPLPAGFPTAEGIVRGFHLGRFCYLLSTEGDELKASTSLRGKL